MSEKTAATCGCDVRGVDASGESVRIIFCQMHKNAKKALELLREAKGAIDDELNAAGMDEVKGHPILRAHDRLSDRIDRFLNS